MQRIHKLIVSSMIASLALILVLVFDLPPHIGHFLVALGGAIAGDVLFEIL